MYKQGSIVLIPFPFTDLSGVKVRPALVVSKEVYGKDIVVVFISSKNTTKTAHDIPIPMTTTNGLKVDSIIKTTKIATLDTGMIIGEIGTIEQLPLQHILSEITSIFTF